MAGTPASSLDSREVSMAAGCWVCRLLLLGGYLRALELRVWGAPLDREELVPLDCAVLEEAGVEEPEESPLCELPVPGPGALEGCLSWNSTRRGRWSEGTCG